MAGEIQSRTEQSLPVKAFSDFTEILEGVSFEKRGRESRRSIRVSSEDYVYDVLQSNFLSGRYGAESMTAHMIDMIGEGDNDIARFHLSNGILSINGQRAGDQGWLLLDKVMDDIKSSIKGNQDED